VKYIVNESSKLQFFMFMSVRIIVIITLSSTAGFTILWRVEFPTPSWLANRV